MLIVLQCWAVSNFITMLRYTLFYYIALLPRLSKRCWRKAFLFTLLSTHSFIELLAYTLSPHVADQPHFYNSAELYSIVTHCWGKLCLNTLLNCSQSYNNAGLHLVLLYCWAVLNLKTLLAYTLTFYSDGETQLFYIAVVYFVFYLAGHSQFEEITELYPIPTQCWGISCLINMLNNPNLKTSLNYTLSYSNADQPHFYYRAEL